jgi:hypothetical protein
MTCEVEWQRMRKSVVVDLGDGAVVRVDNPYEMGEGDVARYLGMAIVVLMDGKDLESWDEEGQAN